MNITLKKDKFEYTLESLHFIGHVLTANGLKPDPGKVHAVLNMPTPISPAAVQRLNGMVKYLAKFIPSLSQLNEPLRKLTHKNQLWNWSLECQQAFDNIKQALSQAPVLKTLGSGFPDQGTVDQIPESIHLADLAVPEKQLQDIQTATASDTGLHTVKRLITSGSPEHRSQVPPEAQPYFHCKHELSILDNIVFKGDRCVVPQSACEAIRKELHSAHLGVENTLRCARETVFWPGITADLKEFLSKCDICNTFQSEQPKEPLLHHELPDRPWEKIGIDLMSLVGHQYLVTVDYYTHYFELDHMTNTNTESVVKRLK
ncbi:uncharacterized protein LOC117108106 [Anneissia japonica]|uniref:uncharacterized protein LOC117108106 n=1 Tax=Anneissia japonica TaxID=1529436 RepID=UPI0014257F81|nr:uncharacterized protein LOC117108106 [Anneissia japonica]